MNGNRLGFAHTLSAAIALVLICLVAAATYTWSHLGNISASNDDSAKRLVPQLARVATIELNVTRASLLSRHAMLVKTPEDLRLTLADIGEKRQFIETAMTDFKANLRSEEGRTQFAALESVVGEFWKVAEDNLAMTTGGRPDLAFEHLVNILVPKRNQLLERVRNLREYQQGYLAQMVTAAEEEANLTKVVLATMIAITGILLLITTFLLLRMLQARLNTAIESASRISGGDLATPVPVPQGGSDEFKPLFHAMHEMRSRLHGLVEQVRTASDHIATASGEVAQGSQDLSVRTENTASNLQQTASAMEQVTATVQHSADSARQANQMASQASQVASRGGAVVGEVVSTMDAIQTSSRKIADIISVIDGIAFQTNILALNAAVEAARAGEQGRGFAVVASEVRNLAQRSAGAAKEIKALIESSVGRVEAGTALVASAGHTMTEIVEAVQRVSDIIGEVSGAASEQSSGIGQVNHSVNQLDQMTQQNAALVEESAAAAASLQAQAATLARVVSSFRLSAAH